MHLAVAAVSRRMARLEDHYGVALFVRTGRGVEPTLAGEALLGHAKSILVQVNSARADIADFANGVRGSVRLHACTCAMSQFLPRDLARFHDRYPDIRLDVREGLSLDIADALRNGDADVGVIVAGPHAASLQTSNYRRDRLVVVAPSGFAPGVTSVKLAEVVEHELVILDDTTATTRMISAAAHDRGLTPRLRVKLGSFDAVCRMIEAGFGLGILPRAAAENFEDTLGLQLIDLEDSWADRQMLICTNTGPPPATPALNQLVDYLAAAALESEVPRWLGAPMSRTSCSR